MTCSRLLPLISLGLALTALGCSQAAPPSTGTGTPEAQSESQASAAGDRLKVVTTFPPMYWFTKAVAGDAAEVEVIVPPGAEVHEYQATPAAVQAIAQADVLVTNGLGLEEFLETTLRNAQNANLKTVVASEGIQALGEISPTVLVSDTGSEHGGHDHDHEGEASAEAHSHAAGNPHVWIDPVLAQQQITQIRDGLIAADPANGSTYETNAAAYLQQVQQLHQDYETRLKPVQGCTFITFHDAYPYLANRYQLQQVAVVQIPEDSLSPSDIQATIDAVKRYDAKALLGEPGVDNKLLASLSQDLKLTLREVDPLESGPLDPQHYLTTMAQNLQTLEAACQ